LLIQPQDGVKPLVAAIEKAKKSVDIVIFRFDRAEIEAALKAAAKRGVSVSALITYTNHGGEKSLRKLEMRLLDAGVTVSRTADDLIRYHDKLLVVDGRSSTSSPSTSPTWTSITAAGSASSREKASWCRKP